MDRMRPLPLLALSALLLGCGEAPPADPPADAPTAQAPATDPEIWIGTLEAGPDGPVLGEATNATMRPGYDNQPSFPDDRTLLYTRQDDAGRTDIWRHDLATGEHSAVTRTDPESEYSATLLPSGDGISVIRVEADSTQRLWRFSLQGEDPAVIFPEVAPVGYHAWADGEHAFLFVLGNPATLQLATRGTPGATELVGNIGRSLQKTPGRTAVSFVLRTGEGATEIRSWAVGADESRLIIAGYEGGDDHAWTPEGVLLQGAGNRVMAHRPGSDGWTEVGSLPAGHIISRLAVSPDGRRIALVVDTPVGG